MRKSTWRSALVLCAAVLTFFAIGITAFAAASGFVIHKVDETGEPLEGVAFEVYGKPTLTYEVSGTTDIEVTKTWDDVDDVDGSRPTSVTVHLLADGKEVASQELTANDGWAHTFSDLDKYDADGNEITYTVTEDAVEGYTTTIDGLSITNTHEPKSVKLTITKKTMGGDTTYSSYESDAYNDNVPAWTYYYQKMPVLTLYYGDEVVGTLDVNTGETTGTFTLYKTGTYTLVEDVGNVTENAGEKAQAVRGRIAWWGCSIYLDHLTFEVYEDENGDLQLEQTEVDMMGRMLCQESSMDYESENPPFFDPDVNYQWLQPLVPELDTLLYIVGEKNPSVQKNDDGSYTIPVTNGLIPGITWGATIVQ